MDGLAKETCLTCYVQFWITKEHQKHLEETKKVYHCPNGHGQRYTGEADTQKIIRLKQDLKSAKNREERAKRSNYALRGVITKMKKKESARDGKVQSKTV